MHDYASEIRLPDYSKLAINWKNVNEVTVFWHDVILNFFWRCFVFSVKFSCITGSGVMPIFFYKGLIRNREIGNTHIWVLRNIWRLGRVKGTKFGTNVSLKKCYWMLQSARVTAFTVFELLKKNQDGGGSEFNPPHPD